MSYLYKVLLTRPTLLDPLCRNCKNRKDRDHYLYHHIRHFGSWWHLRVYFEATEKLFNTVEYFRESFLTCKNISGRLRDVSYIYSPEERK